MYLPDEKSIVGRNLQILINQKNWSIKQAAKELNYDRINLSKMLSGSQNFRIKTLVKFAHFFDVPVFLLFNRLFEDEQYRKDFSFVDEDYMYVFRVNFKATSVKQSLIDLDSTTVSHIINGRRNNPTISTLHQFAEYSKHPNSSSLYITIGSADYPQNNQGFFLEVDEGNSKVSLMKKKALTGKIIETAYWKFEDLKKQLYEKHPSTLWFKASTRTENGIVQFKYTDIEFSRAPQFMTFLSLIKTGIITYDWRGYTSKSGKYTGKNHGNAWRIKPAAKSELFGELEKINL